MNMKKWYEQKTKTKHTFVNSPEYLTSYYLLLRILLFQWRIDCLVEGNCYFKQNLQFFSQPVGSGFQLISPYSKIISKKKRKTNWKQYFLVCFSTTFWITVSVIVVIIVVMHQYADERFCIRYHIMYAWSLQQRYVWWKNATPGMLSPFIP